MNKLWREARRFVALVLSSLLVTALLTVVNPSAANAAPAVTSLSVTSGTTLGGTVVTITGTDLATTSAVTFGGVAGTSIVNTSATQINVTTPVRAAGIVDVVITSTNGTVTVPSAFTYTLATLSPPASFTATPNFNTSSGYFITYAFATASGATSTRAELINNATGTVVGVNNAAATGNSFTGLLPNASYTINLYSVGNSGTYAGVSAAATQTVTTSSAAPAAISFGAATLSLSPTGTNTTQVTAALSASQVGATFYRYTLYDSAGFTVLRTIDVNSLSNTFVGLTPGTQYKASVKAIGNGIMFLNSTELFSAVASTGTGTVLVPAAPYQVAATSDSISFQYDMPTGAFAMRATLYDSTKTVVITHLPNAGAGATFTGLIPGTSYYLGVVAVGDGANYLTSTMVFSALYGTLQANAAQSAPTVSTSNTISNIVYVTANATGVVGPTQFNYFVYDANNLLLYRYSSTSLNTLAVQGLTYGATYKFGVTVMAPGYPESGLSSPLSTLTIMADPGQTALATPSTPTLSSTANSITGSIAAVPNTSGNYLWFLYDSTGTNVLSSLVSNLSPTFSGLAPSTSYRVAVMALSNGGAFINSALSATATITTAATSGTIPTLSQSTPSIAATTTNPSPSSVAVGFTPAAAGTYLSYTLKLYDVNNVLISTVPYFTNGMVVNGLASNTSYSVSLTAIGDGVNYQSSAESAKVTFTTRGSMKLPAVAPTIGILSPQSAILNFTVPVGASSTVMRLYDTNSQLLAVVPSFTNGGTVSGALLPNTTYKASLTFLGNGSTYLHSDESALITFTTPAPIKIGAPAFFQAGQSQATNANINFSLPVGSTYCRLTIYDSTGSTVISRIGQYTSGAVISGLTINTSYMASIKCFANGVGYLDSDESPLLPFSTSGSTRLLAPTMTSVFPTLNGVQGVYVSPLIATAVRVKIYDVNDTLLQTVYVASLTSFNILGLNANTTYKFSLTAVGNGATVTDSDEGDKYTFTTNPVLSLNPPTPTWTATQTTITVSVNQTLVGSNAVRLYNANGTVLLATYVMSSASVAIPNLIPGTQYQISLVALANGSGYSASAESPKVVANTVGLTQVNASVISSVGTTAASATVAFSAGAGSVTNVGRLYDANGILLGVYPGIISGSAVNGLSPSTVYYFTIQNIGNGKLFTNGSESAKFAFTTAAPTTLLAPVLANTGTTTPTSIAVAFTPTAGSVSTTLRIYSRSTGQLISVIPGYTTSTVINNPITPGSSYLVTLQARGNGLTTLSSDESAAISIATPPPITLLAPAVTSSNSTPVSITLAYSIPPGALASQTKLYSADGQTLLGVYSGVGSGVVLGQLQPSTTYQASVIAIGNGYSYLTSPESQRVTIRTAAPVTMATPSFQAYSLGGTSIGLSVNSVVGANTYTVKTYSADGSTLISVLNVTTALTPIGGLAPNTTYQFSVTAIGNGSSYLSSPESPKMSARTSALTTALPTVADQAWIKSIGGFGADSAQNAVLVDGANNVYVGGYFVNQATFGSGANTVQLTATGGQDSFIAKYSANGTLQWVQQSGGTGSDYVNALAFDATGNVVATGVFQGVAAFGQTNNRQAITAMGGFDGYIAKYAPDGTFSWVRQMSGTSDVFSRGVSTDMAGNIFVTGYFLENATFGSGSSKVVLRNFGGADGFVAKYAANGSFTWVKQFGGQSGDQGNGISVDRNGNVFVAGSATTGAVFGTGSNSKEFVAESGSDIFLAKYNNDGDFSWVQAAGGTSNDQALGVATDASGNAYIVGTHFGSTFGTGADAQPLSTTLNILDQIQADGFLAKYDPTGRLVWVRNTGGQSADQLNSVAVDASGNVYAGGQFSISARVSGGGNTQTLVANGSTDGLVAKYASDGTLVWARAFGGAGSDAATGVAIGSSGALAVAGNFAYDQPTTGGVSVFSLGSTSVNLTSAGSLDAFIALLQTGADATSSTLVSPVPQISEIKSTSAAVSFALQSGAASYTLKLYDAAGTTLISTISNYIPGRLITGLTVNTSYKVTLTAIGDGASTLTSAESTKLTFTTSVGSTTPVVFNIGADQAVVSFNPIAGATSYSLQVYDSTGANRLFAVHAATPAATWIYNLVPGTTYRVAVRPFSDGQSNLNFAEGSLVSFTTAAVTTLAAPVSTQSASTATTVTINIPTILVSPQMVSGTRGWMIRVYAADGVTLMGAFPTTNATNVINGLNPATTYKVSVTAIGDGIQYLTSAEGSRVLVSTSQATVAAAPTPIITQVTAGTLAVNFAPIPALVSTSYIVRINGFTYFSATSGAIYSTGVLPNTALSISMQAIGDGTNLFTSALSTPVTLTTPVQETTQLAAPTVAVTAVLQSSANIMPTPVVGARQYFASIYDSTGTNLIFALPVGLGGTQVNNILPNTTYRVEVVAVGNGSLLTNSNPSTRVTFTTAVAGTLATPTNVMASGANATSFRPIFTTVANTVNYLLKVYRSDGTTFLFSQVISTGGTVNFAFAGATSYKFSVTAIGDGINYLNSPESALVNVDLPAVQTLLPPSPSLSSITSNSAIVGFIAPAGTISTYAKIYAADGTTLLASYPAFAAGTKIGYPLNPNTSYFISLQAIGDSTNYLNSTEGTKVAFTTPGSVKLLAPTPQILVGTNRSAFVVFTTTQLGQLAVRASVYNADGSQLLFAVPALANGGTVPGLTPNTTYRIALTALGDGVNFTNSDPGQTVTFTTAASRQLVAPTPSVSYNSAHSFKVNFINVTGATGYYANVYAADGTTLIRSVPVTSGSAIFGIPTGASYKLSLVAVGDTLIFTNSTESAKKPFTFGTATNSALEAPTPTFSAVTSNSVVVNFDSLTGAVSYTLKRYAADGVTLLSTITNFSPGDTVSNLAPDTGYKFSVTAIGDGSAFLNSAEGTKTSVSTAALVGANLLPTVSSVATTSTATSNAISVTFPAATGAVRYTVRVYASDGVSLVASVNNFISGSAITGLIASTSYFVTVTSIGDGVAYVSAAESAKESVNTLAPGALSAPVLTRSGQTSSSISLTFPAQNGATGYTARLYAADGTTLLGVYSPFTSGSSISGLSANTTYKITVRALGDGVSSSNSAESAVLTATTALAPTSRILVSPRSQSAVVSFNAATGAVSYTLNLYNSTGNTLLRSVANFTNGTTLTGLSASTTYQVGLVSVGDNTAVYNSDESALVAFSTPAIITLAAPTLVASTATTTSVSATFAAVPDALSYTAVLYAADGATVLSTLTNFTSGQSISGLTANETYQLQVRAIGDGTNLLTSLASNRVLLSTVNQTTLAAPTPNTAAATSSTVTVNYTATANSLSTTLKLYASDGTTLLRTLANFISGTALTGLSAGTAYKVTLTAIGDDVSYLTSNPSALTAAATASIATLSSPTVTAGASNTYSVAITFSAVSGATSYLAKIYASNGTTLLRTINSVVSGQSISGLTPGTTYVLKFSSIGDGVNYLSSADGTGLQVSTAAQVRLTAPTPAITQTTATTVSFAFTPDSSSESTTARLYTGDGATLISMIANAATGMQFTGLTPDTDYKVTLEAIGDGVATVSSGESIQIAARSAQPSALTAPTGTVSQLSSSGFTLTFSPTANALSYLANIYAADGVTLIASYSNLNPSGTSITGLTQNTTYKVTLVAVGDEATYLSSTESTPVQFTTAAGVVQLGAPNPVVDSVGSTTAIVTFGAVNGASSYAAKIFAADGTTVLQTISNFVSGQVVSGLTLNTSYFVSLNAVGNGVNFLTSGYGPKTSFATAPPTQLDAPTGLSTSSTSSTTSLSFNSISAAFDYAVQVYAANGTTLLYTLSSYSPGSPITGLSPSTTYVLKIAALGDGVSLLDSPFSAPITIATLAPAQLEAPSPSVFSVSQTSSVAVFTSISGAVGYTAKLYNAAGNTLLRTITNFTSGLLISGLTPGTSYQLSITALGDGSSNTTSTESALLQIDTLPVQTLTAPTAFVSAQNPRSLVVSFSPLQGAVSYTALLYAANGTTLLSTVNNFASGSSLTGLTISTSYQVALIARGDGSNYLDSAIGALTATSTTAIPTLFVPDTIASASGTTTAVASFSAQGSALSFQLVVLATDGTTVLRTISNFTSGSTITGLSPSTTYGIAVRAIADGINYVTSGFSSPAFIATAAPVVLSATTGSTSGATFNTINVTFGAVANSTGYTAKLYNAAGNSLLRTITSFTSGTTISGLAVGTSYQVALIALGDMTNYLDSPESNRVSFSTSAAVQLAAPSFTVSGLSRSGFQFNFSAVANAVSYSATLYAANGTTVVQTWANLTGSTTVTGLTANTTYKLAMTAIGSSNYLTSVASALTNVATSNLIALAAPSASTSSADFNSMVVTFGAVANATGYTANLYNIGGTLLRTISSFNSGTTVTGLTIGTAYLVGIIALADQVSYLDSAESTRVNFSTLAPVALPAPTFSVSAITEDGFTFTYSPVANATGYTATLYAANGATVIQTWSNLAGAQLVSGLAASTGYRLTLKALGDGVSHGDSANSPLTVVTTLVSTSVTAPTPPPPGVNPPSVLKVPLVYGGSNGNTSSLDLTKLLNTSVDANAFAVLVNPIANVGRISIIDGKVSVKTPAYFSGTVKVQMIVTIGGIQTIIEGPIVVQPQSAGKTTLTPWALTKSTLRWFHSSNAAYYQVTVNGKIICETAGVSCAIDSAVGPKSQIFITPFSPDGVAGAKSKVTYGSPAPMLAGTVWVNSISTRLGIAEKRALIRIASTIKVAGFSKVILVKPALASNSANAKMFAAQAYLKARLGKSVKFSTKFSSLASGMDIKLG